MGQVRRVKRLQLSQRVIKTYRKPLKVPGLETQQSGKMKDNSIQPLGSMKSAQQRQAVCHVNSRVTMQTLEVKFSDFPYPQLQLKFSVKETLADGIRGNSEKTIL